MRPWDRATLLIALLAGFLAAGGARADDLNHPRIFFDDAMLAWLPDSIAADSAKGYVWDRIEILGTIYTSLDPELVLAGNYGSATFPALGLVANLSEEPLAGEVRAKLVETTLYLVDTDSVMGSGDELAAAKRLRSLLIAYDTVMVDGDSHDRQEVEDEMRSYLEVMTTDFLFTRGIYNPYCSNHSISIGAILVLAELTLRDDPGWVDDPLLADARLLGEQLMDFGLDQLHGADGSYAEGGLYLAWNMRMLIPVWEMLYRLEGIVAWDEAKIAATLDWVAYQLLGEGDGFFLNRNDCSQMSRPLCYHDTLFNWTQHRLPDPRFARWVQDRLTGSVGFNYGSFSDYPSVIFFRHRGAWQTGAERLEPERFFPDQGLYVFRRGWTGDPIAGDYQFTIQAGTFRGGHWQEDIGQFTLRAFGLPLAMDHGGGEFAVDTEAHNLPLIDGLGQHNAGGSIGTDGSLELRVDRGFLRVLRADMKPAYDGHSPFNDPGYPLPGTDWSWGYDGGNPMEVAERWVLLFPGAAAEKPELYLLDDLRKDDGVHDYEWRWHFLSGLETEIAGDSFRFTDPELGGVAGRLLHPAPSSVVASLAEFDNGGPDPDAKVLSVNQSTVDARYFWRLNTLAPGVDDPALSLIRDTDGVYLRSGAAPGRRRYLAAAWNGLLDLPAVELQGRFGVVEEEDGLQRSALLDGTALWFQDALRVALEPKGWAVADVDTVWLSAPELDFEIYSPTAAVVMSGETRVPHVRNGDYVLRDPLSGVPGDEPQASWRLRARAGAPVRLALAGPGAGHARLDVFDLQGRRVLRLLDGPLAPGERSVVWNGRDGAGRRLASGLYFARLEADGRSATARLLLLR